SLVFLAVGVANLGFDTALPTFLVDANTSKSHYKKIIGLHYAPTLCALLIASCIIPIFIRTSTDRYMPLLLGALIVVEGLKKGMRTLLHGAFDNKKTALIELFQIITYVTIIWISAACGLSID